MDSPFPTLIMVITYLYIVTYLGPKVMANRKPFKLNNVLVIYNAGQVVFSFVMLWEVGSIVYILQVYRICVHRNGKLVFSIMIQKTFRNKNGFYRSEERKCTE